MLPIQLSKIAGQGTEHADVNSHPYALKEGAETFPIFLLSCVRRTYRQVHPWHVTVVPRLCYSSQLTLLLKV